MNHLQIVYNKHLNTSKPALLNAFTPSIARDIHAFHQTFPEYEPTPLVRLTNTAHSLGIRDIYVKDESYRFGLNAFKVLGGSYCISQYEKSNNPKAPLTFVTATDGNHGRGIAWAASRLGHKSVVYLPKGSSGERLENIRKTGAVAEITEWNYDDTVRYAQKQAFENSWILVQDTTMPGYEEIPAHIMQGYMTMAYEAAQQLGDKTPTHIFLQAGVGAMAGALTAFFRNLYGFGPKIITAEPENADCIYRTAKADDGELHFVTGDLNTIMAGLACGEPCSIGWDFLKYGADAFLSMEDSVAADGMRLLNNPPGSDQPITSGESGAAGFGAAMEILRSHPEIKTQLALDEQAVVLCFSTEGATDLENYRKITGS